MSLETLTRRLVAKLRWLFETDAEATRRDPSHVNRQTRKNNEAERLDRLRNPGNYRCR